MSGLATNLTVEGTQLFWDVVDLPAMTGGTITYQVKVPSSFSNGTVIQNYAQIESAQNDANEADNVSIVTTTVVNAPPTANPDTYSVYRNSNLTVSSPGVIANDSDITLRSLLVTNVTSGALTLATNGSFTYTPSNNFVGTDVFYYVATNGFAASTPTKVTINVLQMVAPADTNVSCASAVLPPATNLTQFIAQGGIASGPYCGQPTTVTFMGDSSNGGNGCPASPLVITRTYKIATGCGDITNVVQKITVVDNVPPVLSCPSDTTVPLFSLVPAPNPASVTASDNCSAVTVTFVGDNIVTNNVTATITRIYRATDSCGNSTSCSQHITVCQPVFSVRAPDSPPSCGSSGNTLSGPSGASSYHWKMSAPVNSGWSINSSTNSPTITYTAGTNGSLATFTLEITDSVTGCSNSSSATFGCSCAPCVDPALGLGAATSLILEMGSNPVAVTGPAGGLVGDVCIAHGGSFSITGSEYVTGNVKLGAGATFSSSGSTTVGGVINNVDLSAQISAAYAAASNNAALPCTQTFGLLDGSTVSTIVGVPGTNVICVSDIVLAGKQILVTGPSGAKFIFNVRGNFVLTGGGAGPEIRAVSPIEAKDILFNIIGPGQDVAFSGGGGGMSCCAAIVDGTILAPNRKISLSPGLVNGELISAQNITVSSGGSVRCATCESGFPVAVPDTYNLNEGSTLSVPAPGILNNDIEPNNFPLIPILVSPPMFGTLVFNGDGSFTYTPTNFFYGTDTFSYVANNGSVSSSPAIVTLIVNDVNQPPSFTKRSDIYVLENIGQYSTNHWAANIAALTRQRIGAVG